MAEMNNVIYDPENCPYGECKKNCLVTLRGPVHNCSLCKAINDLVESGKIKEGANHVQEPY